MTPTPDPTIPDRGDPITMLGGQFSGQHGTMLRRNGTSAQVALHAAHLRAERAAACINRLILAALSDEKGDGRYAYIAPQFNQAKDVAWMHLKRFCGVIPGAEFNESELRVDLPNGSRIQVYADNPERLRGIRLNGVVLDEYVDMRPSVWGEIVRPLLTDRQG